MAYFNQSKTVKRNLAAYSILSLLAALTRTSVRQRTNIAMSAYSPSTARIPESIFYIHDERWLSSMNYGQGNVSSFLRLLP